MMIEDMAIVAMIGFAPAQPTTIPWRSPTMAPKMTTRASVAGSPRCSVEAKMIVETAAVAPIDSMNRLPLSVMKAIPTAAMPTAATE